MSNQLLSQRLNVGVANIVSASASGLMPASNTNLDDGSATRLGLKQYLSSGSYNGGGAPTVTLSSGGGTLSSVNRAVFIPYQMNDNTWRLKFNVNITLSSTARTSVVFSVNGVTFKSGINQAISGLVNVLANTASSYVSGGGSTFEIDLSSSTTGTTYEASGDVELDSKPTWAY